MRQVTIPPRAEAGQCRFPALGDSARVMSAFGNLQALWVAPPTAFEHYVVQDLSICVRFGSTSELNARSQPSSVRSGAGFPVEMESCWPGRAIGGANGCRSPLVARLTEMVITVALA